MKTGNTLGFGAIWALWAAWLATNHYAPDVMNTIIESGGMLMDTIWKWGEIVNGFVWGNLGEILNSTLPQVGAMAPLAAPMVGWAYLGKKLADAMKIEKKWKKVAMSVIGGWIWAWVHATMLAPYITAAALWIAVAKPLLGLAKWSWKTASGWYGLTVWSLKWGVKWFFKWGKNGAINGFNKPTLNPQVWF